jgi:hypothetical protein
MPIEYGGIRYRESYVLAALPQRTPALFQVHAAHVVMFLRSCQQTISFIERDTTRHVLPHDNLASIGCEFTGTEGW